MCLIIKVLDNSKCLSNCACYEQLDSPCNPLTIVGAASHLSTSHSLSLNSMHYSELTTTDSITITTKPERLWVAHSSVAEDSCLLGCDTEWFLTFQRIDPSEHLEHPTKWHGVISQNTWIHYNTFCSKCGVVECMCTTVAVTSSVLLHILS